MINSARNAKRRLISITGTLFSVLALVLFISGCSQESKKSESDGHVAEIASLNEDKLNLLLTNRLSTGPPGNFSTFSQSIFVSSAKELDYCVLFSTKSKNISSKLLLPTYPSSYKPTLKECLDVVANQTMSSWKYTNKNDAVAAELKNISIKKDIAIFEFSPKADIMQTFEVTIAKDWSKDNKGMFVMYKPSICPVGMDIYDLGTFSADDSSKEEELIEKIPKEVSFFWATKVSKNKEVTMDDFKPAKVGKYDALYYETTTPTKTGFKARWRQWAFMAGNRCYLVISTIFPNHDSKLYPQVQAMLKSFKVLN